MGQKSNPIILRLGNTYDWKATYIENKKKESALYSATDLEIRKFIYQFFKNYDLNVKNCHLQYSEHFLRVFISYKQNFKSINIIKKINKNQNLKLKKKRGFYFARRKKHKNNYKTLTKKLKKFSEYKRLNNTQKFLKKEKIKAFIEKTQNTKRLKLLNKYKKYLILNSNKNLKEIKDNSFLEKFFESLTLFLGRKLNIQLILQHLDKNIKQTLTKKKCSIMRKKLTKLKKYKRNDFFKEGVGILYSFIINKNSSDLLSKFIAFQLKKLKRHNFFLKFIKTGLTVLNSSIISDVKGIKIKIKGRFNGAPRSKHKTIKIGKKIPILTLNSNIKYSEATSYTLNGTFGIKIWTCE